MCNDDQTVLHRAACGSMYMFRLLVALQKRRVRDKHEEGLTTQAQELRREIVKLIYAKDDNGKTALEVAAMNGHEGYENLMHISKAREHASTSGKVATLLSVRSSERSGIAAKSGLMSAAQNAGLMPVNCQSIKQVGIVGSS